MTSGQALDYTPLLEVVDLSWNASIGGNLQCLTSGLQPGNRVKELYLVECQLTAADAQALGKTALKIWLKWGFPKVSLGDPCVFCFLFLLTKLFPTSTDMLIEF